jgi:FixJ family two-component response regulator
MINRDLGPIPISFTHIYPQFVPDKTKLICIVDDDASLRRALGRLVKSFGFDVRLFASPRECLDGFDEKRVACLILDTTLPGINGFELHALLRESSRGVPTIFISAHYDTQYKERARSVGAIAFLNKPFDEKLLLDAIDKALLSS